jgi:hypothetical protein
MGEADMDRCGGAAAKLPESERKDLAILALARTETISDLATEHGVSRKFIYQQAHKARVALDDTFSSKTPEDGVLFQFTITKAWLRQVIVALPLMCRSSYRGVIEFLRDLLGIPVSLGIVHDVLQSAARQADVVNESEDLSGIRVGLHDEIFQGGTPVLAGVEAGSTYCYLLVAAAHRDADTWGVHLLDASKQGLKPDYTIADAGQGLRAGQKAAWGDTPCHGDVFHIQHQYEGLANALSRLAQGARSRRQKLEARIGCAGQRDSDDDPLATELRLARQIEAQASWLTRDIRTLTQWLSHDILALAGPVLATRQVLFDFIVEELARRELADAHRIRPVRVALQNQRDDLLAFAGVLDNKLAAIAHAHEISEPVARETCALHCLPSTSSAYWQGWNILRSKLGERFYALFDAVARAIAPTPRSSSLVENLNSRLRNYFTLRRHLGGSYLGLLRFFLNHRRFMRSRCAERNGKSPQELMTNQGHPHWLTLLGLGPLQLRRG